MEKPAKIGLLNGITRNVIVLGIASLLTDASSEMIFPLLPLFLVNVLAAEKSIVGLIEGIAESTASILKVFSGWFSDKIGKRKPIIFSGYGISTFVKPFLALATSWFHVLAVRFADRVGKGIRTSPRDAMIADSTDEKVRGKAFGFHRSMDTLGAMIGPSIAFLLFPLFGYRNIFLLATIPGVIAVFLILAFVKERERPIQKNNPQPIKFSFKSLSKEFKIFVILAALFALGNFSYAFIILRAQDVGITPELIPLLYLLFNTVYALFSIPAGILSDKIGRKPVIALGYTTFGVMCLGFAVATSSILAIVMFALYGIFNAITETVQRAFVSDLTIAELRATALGTFHAAVGMAALPASIVAGVLWQSFGATATFLYGATLAFLSTILLIILLKNKGS